MWYVVQYILSSTRQFVIVSNELRQQNSYNATVSPRWTGSSSNDDIHIVGPLHHAKKTNYLGWCPIRASLACALWGSRTLELFSYNLVLTSYITPTQQLHRRESKPSPCVCGCRKMKVCAWNLTQNGVTLCQHLWAKWLCKLSLARLLCRSWRQFVDLNDNLSPVTTICHL